MRRTIATLDLAAGTVSDRASNTPTLDVPADFDRTTTSAQLDLSSHLHYSTYGKPVVRPAFVRPLSWRTRGEECLVEEEGGAKPGSNRFLLCAVERLPLETLGELHARRGGGETAPAKAPARKAEAAKKPVDTFGRMLRAARAAK
jgi:hypothetical protein